jgi:hypothetical protein
MAVESHAKRGLFCKYCVMLADRGGQYRQRILKKLVKTPLQNFAKLRGVDGDLSSHRYSKYRKDAVAVWLTTF